MAVKTITIDMEAYKILQRLKPPGESFSRVIKFQLAQRAPASRLLQALPEIALKKETLAKIEKEVQKRKKHVARSPRTLWPS